MKDGSQVLRSQLYKRVYPSTFLGVIFFSIIGPKLPLRLENFAMISSPNETGVIIIGGEVGLSYAEDMRDEELKEPSNHLIELNGETLEWKILDQKLDRGRYNHIAIPISYVYDLENLEVDRGQGTEKILD